MTNWWGIIFIASILGGVIAVLIAASIWQFAAERRAKKERNRRWRRPVKEWWELVIK